MVAKLLRIDDTKVHNNIMKYGNTTAATIPLCLSEARDLGKVKAGDLVCLVAFGSGFTWGSVLMSLVSVSTLLDQAAAECMALAAA